MPKNIATSRFLFSLIINGFTFYGIFFFDWNFFTVIYLFWLEEMVRILFKFIGNLLEFKNRIVSKLEFKLEKKAIIGTLIFMFIYLFFILLIVGYLNKPNNHMWKDNLSTVLFQNMHFNFNLLLMIISEMILFSYLFKDVNKYKESNEKIGEEELHNGFFRRHEREQNKSDTNSSKDISDDYYFPPFSIQMVILHLSIIFGVFSYFSSNKRLYTFTNHIRAATELLFMLVFVALQIVGEFLDFTTRKK